ncbi:MAG: 4'-phosphopantetheinyl transferase superfamily protein [Pseudohongiellaceae bacterium]
MQIADAEIHLWQLEQSDFDLPAVQAECLSWLTDIELQRYQRYQFDRHRKQLLLGRILMRAALSSYNNAIAPAHWTFTQNEYGKPAICAAQNSEPLYFNLSHSGQRAVLAVSRLEDIGIDIEFAKKARRVEAIAQRFFSATEVAQMLTLPKALQLDRFYELWTLKEAYIKACGMGLAIPLQHFSYGFEGEDSLTIEFDVRREDSTSAWQVWQLDAGTDYKLAIAARAEGSVQKISSWQFSSLDRIAERETTVLRSK